MGTEQLLARRAGINTFPTFPDHKPHQSGINLHDVPPAVTPPCSAPCRGRTAACRRPDTPSSVRGASGPAWLLPGCSRQPPTQPLGNGAALPQRKAGGRPHPVPSKAAGPAAAAAAGAAGCRPPPPQAREAGTSRATPPAPPQRR